MYRGSIAHNMYVPNADPNSIDDIDIMEVFVPPLDHYFGLKQFGSRGTKEVKYDQWDIVIYEFRKFIGMLAKGNPNVIGCLWLKEDHYIKKTVAGEMLIENRGMFTCKDIYYSFIGYANGQLKRMEHFACQGYMGEKRKKLVEKFGYDCKNAAHLIRLLVMITEFLDTGEMHVFREYDAERFLEIKRGEWSLDSVKKVADCLFKDALKAYKQSTLRKSVNMEEINELCIRIVQVRLNES